MGLTKQYLSYQHSGTFNIIASGRANINFCVYNRTEGRYCAVPAAEDVILWDMKLGQKQLQFKRDGHHQHNEVTALRVSPDQIHIAVGYSDGIVEIFEIESEKSVASLALHKSCISILRFDSVGIRLISGSLDTEIVISDIIEQIGKHRLIGHNAPVTDGHFLDHLDFPNIVVSSSKDTQIKFWDLETRNCFKTIVDNRTEVWALAFIDNLLITGSKENVLNVYRVKPRNSEPAALIEGLCLDDDVDAISPIIVSKYGEIQRTSKGRTVSLVMDKGQHVLSCHGTNDVVESFYIRTNEEAKGRLMKRLKSAGNDNSNSAAAAAEISLTDKIKRLPTLKARNKIKSIDVLLGKNNELRVILSTANNVLQMHSIEVKKQRKDPELLRSINKCGHQSEVRAVCFSSDFTAIASGSAESLKLWNRNSMQCVKTIPTDYVLCLCFAPGDRYILAGLKTGKLIIADVGTGEILEDIPAHKNEIWSICILPDLKGCVTGSGDATVKIWNFELIENSNADEEVAGSSKILSLIHKNTLKVEESVLAVKISPNSKFITVALLDSTIKIFFLDSFKFYLSLYGHQLPVLCVDISYDSNLIVTGSADRNIKIWGLDFGDCHRSLLAHDDSVIAVQFIPKTHLFFSCGKDGKIKQWDGDSFDKIITLAGHIGEIWSLSVSQNGRYFVTSGSDRCLRLYERTEEPIVLQDVQEDEREANENKTLATGDENDIPTMPGYKLPSRKTVGAEKSAELILECLDIIKNFEENDGDKPEIHPLMIAYQAQTPNDFLIAIIQNIRASDLEEALVLLPFPYVCQLLEKIPELSACRRDQTELICKIALFLLRIHYKPIVSNQILLQSIQKIAKTLEQFVIELRDLIGFNFYSLQLIQHDIEEREGVQLFEDISRTKKNQDKRRKRSQKAKRLHIQMR